MILIVWGRMHNRPATREDCISGCRNGEKKKDVAEKSKRVVFRSKLHKNATYFFGLIPFCVA